MQIYVELDRGAFVETRGVSGSEEDVWEMVNSLDRTWPVLRILDAAGNEIVEGPDDFLG